MTSPPTWIRFAPRVLAHLEQRAPVVALESTVITHGLPRPLNLEIARQMEKQVLQTGAYPATIAMLDGAVWVGLEAEQLERLALENEANKLSLRDLSMGAFRGAVGGTTVAATAVIAHLAGIRVFATGGIGGVHLGETGDVSADLPALETTPVAVVCSGAKSILDLPRTLERLETGSVPVIGWGTDQFPAFLSRGSGAPVPYRLDTSSEIAHYLKTHWGMGFSSGVLICVPCPAQDAIAYESMQTALEQAEHEAVEAGVRGKEVTPHLLGRLAELTGGASLKANSALLRNNARVAGEIAVELSRGSA